ncbi:MAG TPA: DegT/DnrJ/EryC1/StrS family aminotransferase [Vicinamibacterales bacterium]|nr:DegT/DnrJ/EryC1/StrS family aminotransferase [Vicinamibacterales bacterium]
MTVTPSAAHAPDAFSPPLHPVHGMRVPLLDLQAQFAGIRDEVLSAVVRVCDSQRFVMGPEVEAFEHEMAELLGVTDAIGVSSGTDALLVSLMALGVGPGDEVVTSTYSFFATAGAVSRVGATPVFVDIDPRTFNIDVAQVARTITPRTRALMPVHLFGQMADMDPIVELAAQARVPIIEDAAQTIGARYAGRPAGGIGALGCFSFFPSKNLGAFGDAGLVTTKDEALASRVRLLRTHGAERQYHHRVVGGNFRIDALQAAVLRVKAPHLAAWTAARQRNAARYRELFEAAGLTNRITMPAEAAGRTHIYNQFVVRVPDRDRVKAALEARGVATAIYYPVPFHQQECFAYLGPWPQGFPEAERAARESLALPVFGELSDDQLRYVVDSLAAVLT